MRHAPKSRRRPGEVSLERALSKLGVASRTTAAEWIRAGRVAVDGAVCLDPGRPVVPELATIEVDGAPVAAALWRALAFHKPVGLLTTRHDPDGRPTVFDRLGAAGEGLVAVGRLDRDTSGLLLLTSDTRLADWLTEPANGVIRIYRVEVEGRPGAAALAQLVAGIDDRGERLRAERAVVIGSSERGARLELTLTQGKNREVRRLCAAIGHEVVVLERRAFGGIELDALEAGEWRELTRGELRGAFGDQAPIGRGPVRRLERRMEKRGGPDKILGQGT